ncbi:molecular chaperone DnaJ [Candidatus Nitromaritima sp. SCGC AAA799-A02]|nr:molecular chaperone DnaJ [Candidatus Nitromaritima sp. SCGC AAA799-A02]
MPPRDYYKILGVAKDAKAGEIKKSYRERAKRFHPDANNGSKKSENQFKVLSEAYNILSDAKKRREYDRNHSRKGSSRRPSAGWSPPPGDRWGYGFGDYEQQSRTRREEPFSRAATEDAPPPDPDAPTRGFDLQFMIDVDFVTVALGGTIPYSYEKYVTCENCDGTGETDGDPCGECAGKRQVVREATLEVNIPPGVADQYVLRIQNEGGEGKNGGPPGDLFLKIRTAPHPNFKRKKSDIYAEIPISPELAKSGGSLEIETLDSVKTIEVEEETLTGEELRLPGEGAAILWGKKRGDLIIKFVITDC